MGWWGSELRLLIYLVLELKDSLLCWKSINLTAVLAGKYNEDCLWDLFERIQNAGIKKSCYEPKSHFPKMFLGRCKWRISRSWVSLGRAWANPEENIPPHSKVQILSPHLLYGKNVAVIQDQTSEGGLLQPHGSQRGSHRREDTVCLPRSYSHPSFIMHLCPWVWESKEVELTCAQIFIPPPKKQSHSVPAVTWPWYNL